MIEIRHEPPVGPAARELFDDYIALVRERIGPEFVPIEDIFATEDAFSGPGSAWLVVYEDGAAIGCGGLRALEPGVGEIKRMFVVPPARGRGIGRMLLTELERLASEAGVERVRLLTTEVLFEARGLYRSAGYDIASTQRRGGRVEFWLEKRL